MVLAVPKRSTESDSLSDNLKGYTVEKLKELCSTRSIQFTGKSKEELISLLSEKMSGEATRADFSDSDEDDCANARAADTVAETRTWIAQQQERQQQLQRIYYSLQQQQ